MAAHCPHRICPPPPPPSPHRLSLAAPAPPHPRRPTRPPHASLRPPATPPPPANARVVSGSTEPTRGAAFLEDEALSKEEEAEAFATSVGVGEHPAGQGLRAGLGDPVFFLLAFVAVTTSAAFTSMVAVAIPTMLAMKRAANSFTMLADVALEELPSTMAAVRLSGMEISDLTLQLSDLSQEIAGGVNKSSKVAQAVEAGIGQMRDLARQQATSMIEERANLRTIPTAGSANKSRRSSTQPQQRKNGPR